MMQHPFIDQMVAEQRAHEFRRSGDAARLARSVKGDNNGRWARAKQALPQWRKRVPTIRLHRARPLITHHRTAG
jgi:hypothetical protein